MEKGDPSELQVTPTNKQSGEKDDSEKTGKSNRRTRNFTRRTVWISKRPLLWAASTVTDDICCPWVKQKPDIMNRGLELCKIFLSSLVWRTYWHAERGRIFTSIDSYIKRQKSVRVCCLYGNCSNIVRDKYGSQIPTRGLWENTLMEC